jgi:hypothetical protein
MDEDARQALTAMEGQMIAMEGRILARIHDSEMRLLSAFCGWGKPIESRLRFLPTLDERLGFLEERITALERKNPHRTVIPSTTQLSRPRRMQRETHVSKTARRGAPPASLNLISSSDQLFSGARSVSTTTVIASSGNSEKSSTKTKRCLMPTLFRVLIYLPDRTC